MKTISIFLIATLFAFTACTDKNMTEISEGMGDPEKAENNDGWLIPVAQIKDGGPGKDGIPALSNPKFIKASEVTFLNDNDLVLGFADGEDVRAYPHSILDWHEIINDETKNNSFSVIYCPLTGTGIGWDRMINGAKTSFGVSGLLYNSNIIPYDRATDSNWSQLLFKSINGGQKGKTIKTHNLIETSWKTWKAMYPNSNVVSTNTGYSRSYGRYPYGDYKTSKNLIFPVSSKNVRHHEKERVLAVIIDDQAKAFSFNYDVPNSVISNGVGNTKLVVVKNSKSNLMVSYNRKLIDGTELNFEAIENELPLLLLDNEGNKWDVFGRAVSGPRTGQELQTVPQMMGYWFAFAAFYPEIQ